MISSRVKNQLIYMCKLVTHHLCREEMCTPLALVTYNAILKRKLNILDVHIICGNIKVQHALVIFKAHWRLFPKEHN